MSWRGGQLATPCARRFHGLSGCVKRPISNQAGLGRDFASDATSRANRSSHWRSNSEFHQSAGLERARLPLVLQSSMRRGVSFQVPRYAQPKSVLEIAAKHYAQATRGRYVRSGRDTFGFGRDRQAEWRFQEELRLDCRSHSPPGFDKCCSASLVFLANFDSKYRSCVGLMVAVNKISKCRER